MHDLKTLRTVRPELPAPEPAVPLWTTPEWVELRGHWRLGEIGFARRTTNPRARVRIELLRHAVQHAEAPEAAASQLRLTEHRQELDGYRWYQELDVVTGIRPLARAALRRATQSPGVHRCRSLRIEVTSRHSDEKRTVPARMWVVRHDTILLAGDYTPSVGTLARIMIGNEHARGPDFQDAVRNATELLGRAGRRETHAELERQFTAELRERIGKEMEVEVRIRARNTDEGPPRG